MIDVNQIETALLNIAITARDAMPEGGTLLIETANIDGGSAELPDEMAGRDCVLVSMRDTGTGMSPKVSSTHSSPFSRHRDSATSIGTQDAGPLRPRPCKNGWWRDVER
jgi:signal transduction histidine kinase